MSSVLTFPAVRSSASIPTPPQIADSFRFESTEAAPNESRDIPLLDRILPISDRHLADAPAFRIRPVRTVRSQRAITRVRLVHMEAELAGGAE
jgi:hypothetical protein